MNINLINSSINAATNLRISASKITVNDPEVLKSHIDLLGNLYSQANGYKASVSADNKKIQKKLDKLEKVLNSSLKILIEKVVVFFGQDTQNRLSQMMTKATKYFEKGQ